MKLSILLASGALAAGVGLFAQALPCRLPRELRPTAENLRFANDALGNQPTGWFLGPEWYMPPHLTAYEPRIVSGDQCNGGTQCAKVQSVRYDPSIRQCFLYQIIDATQYRGKRLTYHADVRTDGTPGSVARLLVRVHRTNCNTSFRDDMGDHPITATAWSPYEIQAPIPLDAQDIEFGIQLFGKGTAWIDNISLVFADTAR